MLDQQPQGIDGMSGIAKPESLVDVALEESVALTIEARNYIAYHEQADRRQFNLPQCLHVGYQHTRVSARLIQATSWLLAVKALLAGEITEEQFNSPQFSLGGGDECMDPAGPEINDLPHGLRSLLERSHKLYMRIRRLDAMVRTRIDSESDQPETDMALTFFPGWKPA